MFQKFDVKLVVHSTCSQVFRRTRDQELSEDLLAIINFFVASNKGRHAAKKSKDARKMRTKEKLKKMKILISIKKWSS